MAPLAVAIPGHAILNFRTVNDIIHYFDTYAPFKKTTTSVITAYKVMLYPRAQAVPDAQLLVDIKYLDSGRQVEKLIAALVNAGWIKCADWPAVYDQRLADFVFKYQLANLPRNNWTFYWHLLYYKGRLVDSATRETLNNLIK